MREMLSNSISKFLLLLLMISCIHIKFITADFCQSVGDNNNSTIPLYINTSTTFTQSTCSQYFEVDINSTLPQNYTLFFELVFLNFTTNPKFMPFLIARDNYNPIYLITNPVFDYADKNAWKNRKQYHSIAISSSNLTVGDKMIFGVFQTAFQTDNYQEFIVQYQVRVSTSLPYPCPQGCSGNGYCTQNYQKCYCNEGYFDNDCSIKATKLNLKQTAQQVIASQSWQYFYFPINSFSDSMEIDLQKNAGIVDYSFKFDQQLDYTIPNYFDSDGRYRLTDSKTQGSLVVGDSDVSSRLNYILLVGAYNNYTQPVSAQVTVKSYNVNIIDDTSTIRVVSMYLMIGISAALICVWLFFTLFRFKSHMQMEALLRNYQTEREQDKVLTKKDINKYFPKMKFSESKSSFSQNMCSVCLEDFEGESNCRQLYCEHIYHSDCIEAWFGQHYSCPNCKKDMTKSAIEEAAREKIRQEGMVKPRPDVHDDKRLSTEENKLNPQSPAGVKEIQMARVEIAGSRHDREEAPDNNGDPNSSPEKSNLLGGSSVTPPPESNDYQLQGPNSMNTPTKFKSDNPFNDFGLKDSSMNLIENSSRNDIQARNRSIKRNTYISQKRQTINQASVVDDIKLD